MFSKFLSIYLKNMIIINNKSAFSNLKINRGGSVSIERLSPQETRNIVYLTDLQQISNTIVMKNGTFSVVEEIVSPQEEIKKEDDNLFELELKKAKEKTNEYLKNNL